MKLKLLATIILFSFALLSFGQIEKGTYLFDFSGSYRVEQVDSRQNGFYELSYMKAVSSKIMLGGQLSYQHSYYSFYNSINVFESIPFQRYRISPAIRYFFSKKRLSPFTELNYSFVLNKLEEKVEVFLEEGGGHRIGIGLGINYSITNRILFESMLSGDIVERGVAKDYNNSIVASFGFKFLLHPKSRWKCENLANNIFSRGVLSSFSNFSMQYSDNSNITTVANTTTRANTRFSYFILDRFAMHAIYTFSTYRYSSRKSDVAFTSDLDFGLAYFFRLKEQLFLNLKLSTDFSRNSMGSELKRVHENFDVYRSSIGTSLHYFTKEKKFYFGIQHNSYVLTNNTDQEVFLGLDYFVAKNIYFNANVNFRFRDAFVKYRELELITLFSVGVGYVLDSKTVFKRDRDRKEK